MKTLTIVCLLVVPIESLAQWGPGGCPPFGPVGPPPVLMMPQYPMDTRMVYHGVTDGWHEGKDQSGGVCHYFYRGGKREAVYLPEVKAYRTLSTSAAWSAPVTYVPAGVKPFMESCPCCGDECPCKAGKPCKKSACQCIVGKCEATDCTCGNETCKCPPNTTKCGDECFPTGVIASDVAKFTKRYSVGSVEVDRKEFERQLGSVHREGSDGKIVDDSTKPSFTVIGSKADCDSVLSEVPADLKDRWHIQSFRPDDWLVKDAGFVTTGQPTIYLQHPDGRVAFRQDTYKGAQTWEAIRKPDPSYNPNKDPNGSSPSLPNINGLPSWVWIGGGAFLLYWLFKKPQVQGA